MNSPVVIWLKQSVPPLIQNVFGKVQVVTTIATHVLILIVIRLNVKNLVVNGRIHHVMIMTIHAHNIVKKIAHHHILVIGTKMVNVKNFLHVKITHMINVPKLINMDVWKKMIHVVLLCVVILRRKQIVGEILMKIQDVHGTMITNV